jgi:hypothetical protein
VSEVEELRRLGEGVVKAWERLGQCEDEFGHQSSHCGEWAEALDTAILKLSTALSNHAFMAGGPPAREIEDYIGAAPHLAESMAEDVPGGREDGADG